MPLNWVKEHDLTLTTTGTLVCPYATHF